MANDSQTPYTSAYFTFPVTTPTSSTPVHVINVTMTSFACTDLLINKLCCFIALSLLHSPCIYAYSVYNKTSFASCVCGPTPSSTKQSTPPPPLLQDAGGCKMPRTMSTRQDYSRPGARHNTENVCISKGRGRGKTLPLLPGKKKRAHLGVKYTHKTLPRYRLRRASAPSPFPSPHVAKASPPRAGSSGGRVHDLFEQMRLASFSSMRSMPWAGTAERVWAAVTTSASKP